MKANIKYRMTKQKKVILNVLRSTKSHPTADWIYEQAKKEIPELSLGTVYRNLNFLKSMGEIIELNYGSSYSRYDGNPVNHYHFKCTECGNIYDLELPIQNSMEKIIEEETGHIPKYHRTEFYGVCRKCNKEN